MAKSKPKKTKISKQKILARLTLAPTMGKRLFYAREMKLLNDLCERYSLEFMNVVSFDKKFDSLAYLVCDKLKEVLDKKFRAFNFKVDFSKYKSYDIGEKSGEDFAVKREVKSVKKFLDE
jgi:hypothetical protein